MQSVFGDSQFSKYQRKFGAAKEQISPSCYSCNYIPHSKARKDSIQAAKDSLEFDISEGDMLIEENHSEGGENKAAEPAGEKKKKKNTTTVR